MENSTKNQHNAQSSKLPTRRSILKGSLALTGLGSIMAPAVHAAKKYRWKMVTTWPANFPGIGTGAVALAKRIEALSDGQIKIRVFGAGELVPALGCFDAVSRGTAEMSHGAAYYWKGKHPATQFFAAVPFGLTAPEMNGWFEHGGAQKLWDDLYAPFNLKPFVAGNTGVQMGGWFKKEVKSVADFKGLKIRMPGLGGEVLAKLGAAVVTLPGGEIFQSLKSGTIDASEWIGPYNDLAFGFYQAASNYYWPGWQEPGSALECLVNKKVYDGLPSHLKSAISVACQAANESIYAEFIARNSQALETLVNKHKVQLRKFPDDVLKAIAKASSAVVADIASKDKASKQVNESFQKFRRQVMGWSKVSETGYSVERARFL